MALASIELQNVSLEFDGHIVLKNVSLAVSPGEKIVLIGPSGHGKTALLKVMAGLLPPTSGSVLINGKNLQTVGLSEKQRIICKMGMLFQKNALFDSLTCAENISFPLREVRDLPEEEINRIVDKYLDAVGIASAQHLYPDKLSGGMQKRLGIARALALEPKIVFYDDPTAGLDPITSRKIVELILNLQKKKRSTLVATINDMNRVYQMADRIFMVVDQDLIDAGNPTEIRANPDPRVQQFIHGALQGPLTAEA